MDIFYFLKVLWQRIGMLIFVVVVAAGLTYYLVGLLPQQYKSNAVLSTGITVRKNIRLSNEDPFVQKYEIVSAFSNLTAIMKSRTVLRLLTFRLLMHDLAPDSLGITPFRQIEGETKLDVNQARIDSFVRFLYQKEDSLWTVSMNRDQNRVFNQVAKALEYDFESLEENLQIGRMGETDYLNLEFTSEHPSLCEFAINAFAEEFLKYNKQMVNRNENEAVNFYYDLARRKRGQLDALDKQLGLLKEENKIVNLDEQTKTIVDQLSRLEFAREETQQSIPGLKKTIDLLDNYLLEYAERSDDRQELVRIIREGLVNTVNEIKEARIEELADAKEEFSEKGLGSGAPQRELENNQAAQRILIQQYIEELKRNKIDLDATLEDILIKKINAEVDLALAEEGVKSLDAKIRELKQGSTELIEVEAQIKTLESQREMALQEYLQASSKLNDARVIAQSSLYPMSVFEYPQIPEEPEPSRKLLFAAFAGAGAGGFFVFVIFLLTLFDNTLSSPEQFEKLAQIPLLGSLVRVPKRKLELKKIFSDRVQNKALLSYKEALRKIRQQMETTGAKRFLFTSTVDKTDKSIPILSVAYSLRKKGYQIIILDTNFKKSQLTNYANLDLEHNPLQSHPISISVRRKKPASYNRTVFQNEQIDIIGNHPSNESPAEILAGQQFENFLKNLELQYDFILMEAPGLNEYADTIELINYAERVVVIFEAQSVLKRIDQNSINYFKSLDNKFMGGILNGVEMKNLD